MAEADAGQAEPTGRRDAGRFRPSSNAIVKRLGEEIVLVHLQTNRIYTLNRTGARFWDLLAEGHDLARAREELLIEFDVDDQQLLREMDTITDELVSRGLLEPDASG